MSAPLHAAHKLTEMFLHSNQGKAAVASTAGLIMATAPVVAPTVAVAAAAVVVTTGCFVGVWKAGEWLSKQF
jgi:hypothetical protein